MTYKEVIYQKTRSRNCVKLCQNESWPWIELYVAK